MKKLCLTPWLSALALGLCSLSGHAVATAPNAPVRINVVAINDLHGNLEPTLQEYPMPDGSIRRLHYGGIATLGAILDTLRRDDPDLLLIGAGDLIGASPANASLWADEPVFEALSAMGMLVSSAGNHELDAGKVELLRQINGGCESPRPTKACQLRGHYAGSGFPYIAANLIDTDTGKRLLPAYHVVQTKGVKVAFVGAVPRDTASLVNAEGFKGLKVTEEAEAINQVIPELKAQGVNAIVALLHQGGHTPEAYDKADCTELSGIIVDVTQRLDPAVDAVISGHTHQTYQCKVDAQSVTQAGKYGHFMTQVSLDVTPGKHQVTQLRATQHPVDPQAHKPNAQMSGLLEDIQTRSKQQLQKPVGRIAVAELMRAPNGSGESQLGNLVADAHLTMTKALGTQIALTNMGGLRAELIQNGDAPLTYEQLFAVQPFSNHLVLRDLTGEQLVQLLNQQWATGTFRPLQLSEGFQYTWDAKRPLNDRVVPGSLKLDGKPITLSAHYRVVANAFLADGGNAFSMFTAGIGRKDTGINDLDALVDYVRLSNERGILPGKWEQPRAIRLP